MSTPRPIPETDALFFSRMDLLPCDLNRSRAAQARDLLECMEAVLQDEGLTFAHVVRTWFYLDAILDWYGEFNAVRNAFFEERGVFRGLVPASTGIGLPNPAGAALTGGLLAVKPHSDRMQVFAVPSPRQCPALAYHSAFSRAVELQLPGQRQLYVSGTASIDATGATAHPGDVAGQIRLTMEVVEALLASRGMTWADTTRAVAYFTSLADMPRFTADCQSRGLPNLPVTCMSATICRGDLLFELELDAVRRD